MAEPKTKATRESVDNYIDAIDDELRRDDCRSLVKLMTKVTKEPPTMWGTSIVGFGKYHYNYASGHEGDSCLAGFSSRKGDISIYVMAGFAGQAPLLAKLGKHRVGKACLYVKRLADIDLKVLESLVKGSVAEMRRRYPD
jgi:Domain of unknown function (DU1801)